MSEASQRGGAPKGNRNAYKGKAYYPKRLFGQKWEYATGAAIAAYLSEIGQGQMRWLEEHLLPLVPPLPDETPTTHTECSFKIGRDALEFLKRDGKLTPEELARFVIVD